MHTRISTATNRLTLICLGIALCAGCSKPPPIPLTGGKPVAYWVNALRSTDPKLRREAAFKLGNVGDTDPAAVPALTSALKDIDPKVRIEAIVGLLKSGEAAKAAIGTLTDLKSRDRDPNVREAAGKALDRLAIP